MNWPFCSGIQMDMSARAQDRAKTRNAVVDGFRRALPATQQYLINHPPAVSKVSATRNIEGKLSPQQYCNLHPILIALSPSAASTPPQAAVNNNQPASGKMSQSASSFNPSLSLSVNSTPPQAAVNSNHPASRKTSQLAVRFDLGRHGQGGGGRETSGRGRWGRGGKDGGRRGEAIVADKAERFSREVGVWHHFKTFFLKIA